MKLRTQIVVAIVAIVIGTAVTAHQAKADSETAKRLTRVASVHMMWINANQARILRDVCEGMANGHEEEVGQRIGFDFGVHAVGVGGLNEDEAMAGLQGVLGAMTWIMISGACDSAT